MSLKAFSSAALLRGRWQITRVLSSCSPFASEDTGSPQLQILYIFPANAIHFFRWEVPGGNNAPQGKLVSLFAKQVYGLFRNNRGVVPHRAPGHILLSRPLPQPINSRVQFLPGRE